MKIKIDPKNLPLVGDQKLLIICLNENGDQEGSIATDNLNLIRDWNYLRGRVRMGRNKYHVYEIGKFLYDTDALFTMEKYEQKQKRYQEYLEMKKEFDGLEEDVFNLEP